jgi:dienelactone hydrolase
MDTLEFLTHRVMFMGLPFGEVGPIEKSARSGASWRELYFSLAQEMRALAEDARAAGRYESAVLAWRWSACSYHAASLNLHLQTDKYSGFEDIIRLRGMAREAYRNAIEDDVSTRTVEIPASGGRINGYLRTPLTEAEPAPLIVLLNGLDSLCEVEMHSFGDWLLARKLAVLALDLPAALSTSPRLPILAVESVATAIADWVADQTTCLATHIGAFGVSFGGHLVARLLAGDPRFSYGVAVSPAAWMSRSELKSKRVRLMLACAFDLHSEEEIQDLASRVNLKHLSRPSGKLCIFQMLLDELFGPEHISALCEWGGNSVEVRQIAAEHVGTSQFHHWLPEACDWLGQQLRPKEFSHYEINNTASCNCPG